MTRDFLRHVAARWYLYLVVFAIWACAVLRVFYDPTPRIPILFNVTPSLPYWVAVVNYRAHGFKRGDCIVYSFDGEAKKIFPGLKKQPFFKVIRGIAGDRITVRDRHVFINGEDVGFAKTHTVTRLPLEPIQEMVIPDRHFYVQGSDPDSFDSRYQISGLVSAQQIIATVTPIF